MKIKRPLLGKLNQGVFFSCARAEGYADCPVYGLVITARCDIAQDKFPVLNYVPVVPLDPWLCRDGLEILQARAHSDAHARLEAALENIGIAKSVLHSQSAEELLQTVFRDPLADKRVRSAEPKFADTVARLALLGRPHGTYEHICDVYDATGPLAKGILRELAQNKITGYYFLPRIDADGDDSGYVALLRNVSNLPKELAVRIAQGLEANDAALNRNPHWRAHVSLGQDGFAMPIGEVTSPTIEHILQTFSALFSRIGLDDLDPNYLRALAERRPVRRGDDR